MSDARPRIVPRFCVIIVGKVTGLPDDAREDEVQPMLFQKDEMTSYFGDSKELQSTPPKLPTGLVLFSAINQVTNHRLRPSLNIHL